MIKTGPVDWDLLRQMPEFSKLMEPLLGAFSCKFCSSANSADGILKGRDAAHLLAVLLNRLGVLTDQDCLLAKDSNAAAAERRDRRFYSEAGCTDGYARGLPIRVADLLTFFAVWFLVFTWRPFAALWG
jgi:hypothetical protein